MAVVFLLILFVFLSAISTWFFYQNQIKENKLKSDDYMFALSSGAFTGATSLFECLAILGADGKRDTS